MLPVRLRRRRLPLLVMVNWLSESVSGLFLFATQTTASGVVLYHIPRYLFLELPGEKKPSSKFCLEETKVCPSEIDCVGVMVSTAAVQLYDFNNKWMRKTKVMNMEKLGLVSISCFRLKPRRFVLAYPLGRRRNEL